MLSRIRVEKYHAWFGGYVRPFLKEAGHDASAVALKIVHSQRVRREIVEMGKSVGLNRSDLLLAEVTGLFHDIGRFEQFRKFHTFNDSKSIDHAVKGREVLERERILDDLSPEDRSIILDAVFYHNKLAVPLDFRGRKLTICRLIRDADKLDILRVFDEIHQKGHGCQAAGLGLPQSGTVSEKVYEDILQEKVVNFKDVRNATDFLVMRLSWLYDINFPYALKKIQERGYIERMAKMVPEGQAQKEIFHAVNEYMRNRIQVDL